MPTTTGGLALPYPAPGDAPSGPYALQQLAERVEAALATTDRPRCEVYLSAAPSIPNNAATAVAWDTEAYDVGNMHAAGSSQIKATKPGLYLITADVEWSTFTAGVGLIQVRLNGVSYRAGNKVPQPGQTLVQNISYLWQAALNDYAEVMLLQSTGAAKSPVVADRATCASAVWLGP